MTPLFPCRASAAVLFGWVLLHPMPARAQPVDVGLEPAAFAGEDAALFTDEFFVRLKPGVTAAHVSGMRNPVLKKSAEEMLEGRFDREFRARLHVPFEPVEDLARRLKTSTYSRYENPTGIYFEDGEEAVLCVGPTGGESLQLRVTDFGRRPSDRQYPLRTGVNVVRMRGRGLGYISYFTPNHATAPPVAISILTGRVNGFFNAAAHDQEKWKALLENAACEVIDIIGQRIHLVYPVAELRKHCPERGPELVALYDQIIRHQHQIMGLEKYRIVPKNHMFGRVIWRGYMHADGIGAAFHNDTMASVAHPDRIPRESWGIAHEFGHVNQTRPGLRWVATTEVSNNIFSSWTNFLLNPHNMRLEDERIDGGEGAVTGGRYNAFFNSAVVDGEPWLCQRGPDKMTGYQNGGDHFVKLVPLWQLQLYTAACGMGRPDLYPDVFQKVRETDESELSHGQLQLNFMRNVCDAQQLDYTDFFERVGMLRPLDRVMDDYTSARLAITPEQCRELKAHAARYPKPESPVIQYLSARSVDAFKHRRPVEGAPGQGVSGEGSHRIVDHAVWRHAVVYETYQDDQLVRVTLVGSGSRGNRSTRVSYPAGATRIEAVAWDGRRTLVYGARPGA